MTDACNGNGISDLDACFNEGLENDNIIESRVKREIVSSHRSSSPRRVFWLVTGCDYEL